MLSNEEKQNLLNKFNSSRTKKSFNGYSVYRRIQKLQSRPNYVLIFPWMILDEIEFKDKFKKAMQILRCENLTNHFVRCYLQILLHDLHTAILVPEEFLAKAEEIHFIEYNSITIPPNKRRKKERYSCAIRLLNPDLKKFENNDLILFSRIYSIDELIKILLKYPSLTNVKFIEEKVEKL